MNESILEAIMFEDHLEASRRLNNMVLRGEIRSYTITESSNGLRATVEMSNGEVLTLGSLNEAI